MGIFIAFFIHNINVVLLVFGLFWAIFLGIFLYWRAGRRELVESQTLLDVVAVFFAGALVFGRLLDFLIRFDYYHLSLKKLIFINAYSGFDTYGAFLGGILLVWFYTRNKREKFWFTFDMGASAIAFAALGYLFFKFLALFVTKNVAWVEHLYYVVGYFIIFWTLKRFETKKKHDGFFACLFLVSSSILNLVVNIVIFKKLPLIIACYHLISSIILICIVSVVWYIFAKRKFSKDVKGIVGEALLFVFKIKRVITNVREADNTARAIILSPLYLVKWVYFLVKCLVKEFVLGLFDLASFFKFKK